MEGLKFNKVDRDEDAQEEEERCRDKEHESDVFEW
jgi:hypothetical protein